MAQFSGQRGIDFAVALLVRIIPQAIVTVAVVEPARMIENRIEANAVEGDAGFKSGLGFATDVAEPAGAKPIFGAGFGDKERAMIALVNLGQHLAERAIQRMLAADGSEFADTAKAFQVVEPL